MLKVIHLSHTIWYKCYCFITQQSLLFSLSQVFSVFVSISWKLINHIFAFDSDNNSTDSDSVAFHSDDDEQRQSVETTKLWWKVNWFNLPYWLNEKLCFKLMLKKKTKHSILLILLDKQFPILPKIQLFWSNFNISFFVSTKATKL